MKQEAFHSLRLVKQTQVMIALVILATLILYSQMIGFWGVNYDDPIVIFQNWVVRDFVWKEIFFGNHSGLYYPLTMLTLSIDFWLGSRGTWVMYMNNMIFHGISGVLVFFIVRRWFQKERYSEWLALFVALLFVVHPLKAESVAWLTCRKDVLSGMFALLSLLQYLKYSDEGRTRNLVISIFCFSFAILSKVSVFPILLFFVLYDVVQKRGFSLRAQLPKLIYVVIFLPIFYLNFKYQAQVRIGVGLQGLEPERLLMQLIFYHEKFLLPIELRPEYLKSQMKITALGLGVLTLFAVLSALILRYQPRRRANWVLGYAFFFLMLLPYLKLVDYGDGNIVNDRYMYLAMTGLCIAYLPSLFDVFQGYSDFKIKRLLVFAALFIVGLMAQAFDQVGIWRNSETLWSHTILFEPLSVKANSNLGAAYIDQNRCPEAIALFKIAGPTHGNIVNMAFCQLAVGDKEGAYKTIHLGMARAPKNAYFRDYYATMLIGDKKFEEAFQAILVAEELMKNEFDPELILRINSQKALVLIALGRIDEAIQFLEGLKSKIRDDKLMATLAVAYEKSGQLDKAVEAYKYAIDYSGQKAELKYGLALIYQKMGLKDQAQKLLEEVRQQQPQLHEAAEALSNSGSGPSGELVPRPVPE